MSRHDIEGAGPSRFGPMVNAIPTARPKVGRPSIAEDRGARARNLRWYVTYVCGSTLAAIGAGESPPVHESTVSRGVKEARKRVGRLGILTLAARLAYEHERAEAVA